MPKSVQASSTAVPSAAQQSSRASFVDTLASVSSTQVQGTRNAQSQGHSGSNSDASDTTQKSAQTEKSAATQSRQSVSATQASQRSLNETAKAQQSETKASTPEVDSSAAKAAEKDAPKTDQQAVRKTSPKKTASTGQEAPSFNLQDATVQMGLVGIFSLADTAAVASDSAGSADLTGQSLSTQAVTGIADQGTDAQSNTSAPDAINAQTPQTTKESDSAMAALVLQAAQQADAKSGIEADSAGASAAALSEKQHAAGVASAVTVADTNAVQAVDSATALQTSQSARISARSAMKQGNSDSTQPAVTQIQSKSSGPAIPSKVGAGKTDKDEGNASGHSSSQNFGNTVAELLTAQNAGSHTQSTGIDAMIPQAVAAQTEIRTAAQTATPQGPAESAAHGSDATDGTVASRWQGGENAGMSGISTARLIQNMSGTEMRVGMHSNEFGDISIRTSVSQQQMQTQISVDHNELGNALSAHISSMQAKMGSDYGLHATIEVNQGGASFSNDGTRSQNQQQQPSVSRIETVDKAAAIEHEPISLSAMTYASSDARLDIRA